MKNRISSVTLALALVGSTLPLRAADPPALDENLKPLAKLIGTWSYEWKDARGQMLKGTYTCRVAAGGKAIVAHDELLKDGKVFMPSVDVSYWQPESKSIANAYFGWDASHNVGILTKVGSTMVYQIAGYDGQGKVLTAIQTQEWKDDDTFVWQQTHSIVNGEAQPDTQKCILKRVKDTPVQNADRPSLNEHLKPLAKYLGK